MLEWLIIAEQNAYRMDRIYKRLVLEHLKQFRQMVFLAGPRQVGKQQFPKN